MIPPCLFSNFQLPIIHSAALPNLALSIVVKCSCEYADLPIAFHNSFAKIWRGGGVNRLNWGELESRECSFHSSDEAKSISLETNYWYSFRL